MSDAEIAMRMNDYTGDPSTRGFIWTQNQGKRQLLNYHSPNELQRIQAGAYKGLGITADALRMTTPWSGVLAQSPASTLKAMRENPVRANIAFLASGVMPQMVAYMWNMYHSNVPLYIGADGQITTENTGQPAIGPDGKQMLSPNYVNYSQYGRSDYNVNNNTYFAPLNGAAPNTGTEWRGYQEQILTRRMTDAFMHQYMGKSVFTMREEIAKALWGFVGGAIAPPQPSWVTAGLGAMGYVAPEGWMGGLVKKRNNEYIELGGGENVFELMMRGIMPSIADMSISALHAGMHAPTWGDVPAAAGKQVLIVA